MVGQPGSGAFMTAAASPPALALHQLTVHYRQHRALQQVSGHFDKGSLTAVIGPNGAGKSTLLKSLAGLVAPQRPSRITRAAGLRLAYLPQHSELDRNFPLEVRDCALLGLWAQSGAWGCATAPMLARVHAALEAVGLHGLERRTINTLSSGQLQRVLFARLAVQDADIILLDEPFNAVDSATTTALLTLVQHWHRQGRTVIAAVHDDAQVREHFPHTLLLARECIAWGPTAEVLTDAHLQRARAALARTHAEADAPAYEALPA